jgi:general secretion pathway protein J
VRFGNRAAPRRSSGFTLLELLVALVIFGLLISALVQGTRIGLSSWRQQNRRIEAQDGLDELDRVFRGLVATIDPGTRLVGPPNFVGNARSVGFTADLPAGVSGFLTREADVLLLVDHSHRLILRWAPHYQTLTAGPPSPHESQLLDHVDHVELSYWVPGSAHAVWVDHWQSDVLPDLLRLRIVFMPGDFRHWPDIVAAVDGT